MTRHQPNTATSSLHLTYPYPHLTFVAHVATTIRYRTFLRNRYSIESTRIACSMHTTCTYRTWVSDKSFAAIAKMYETDHSSREVIVLP